MKKQKLRSGLITSLGMLILFSCGNLQNTDESLANIEFKVYGNCGMCEKTIEGALNGQEGITDADWNKVTKMITVRYDPEMMDEYRMKLKIAKVGYDTDSHRANDATYSNLPDCCQYDRP